MRKIFSGHRERDHIAVNGGTPAEQKGAMGLGALGEEEDCWRVQHMYEEVQVRQGHTTAPCAHQPLFCDGTRNGTVVVLVSANGRPSQ